MLWLLCFYPCIPLFLSTLWILGCVCTCVCVFNTWWRVIGQCTRAISAASVSATVTESPETLPANSFPVRVLPYLMIREHVKRRWKPVQERTYRLIIQDQTPSFITHDLTVYDSCNLCVMAWTDVCVSWKKKKKGVEVSYGRRLFCTQQLIKRGNPEKWSSRSIFFNDLKCAKPSNSHLAAL